MLMLFQWIYSGLLEIANSGSANADAVLEFATGFARNGTLSNGFQGTPIEGFPAFYQKLDKHVHVYCPTFNPEIGPPHINLWGGPNLSLTGMCM